MLRVLMTSAVVAAFVYLAAGLVARAYDQASVQRVLFTRHGVWLECDRIVRDGKVYFENCDRVP